MNTFDYETLTYDDRQQIHDALAETTLKHVASSGGLFTALDLDIAQNPSQDVEVVHLRPTPTPPGEVATLARIASPAIYDASLETLAKQKPFVSAARYIMEHAGTNIYPVTNHATIEDVAIFTAAWSQEILDEDAREERTGLIISRGVTTIGAFGLAASEVVQKAGHIFMSFPRTKTIDGLDIDSRLIDTNNRRMRHAAHAWLGDDLLHKVRRNKLGKTLGIAWSGKTDNVVRAEDGTPESVTMAPVSNGTIDLVKRGLVMPVVLWNRPGDPVVEIGELTQVKNLADARRVQRWQAETLANALDVPVDDVQIAA